MILPVYALGQPVLKKKAAEIDASYPELKSLIDNMWETMYFAKGVGLAAPQVGLSIRLFVVDTKQMYEGEKDEGIKQAFINAKIELFGDDEDKYEEGCLSIPDVQGDVVRPLKIRISFLDENFKPQVKIFEGIEARVIQHEYDHIEGVLFIEKLGPVRRKRIAKRLEKIRKGQITAPYKLKFA